jgi:uncharacterized membrane protein
VGEVARRSILHPRRAVGRSVIALASGLAAGLLVPVSPTLRVVCAWDTFALVLCAEAWWLIARSGPAGTRARAGAEDPGRAVVTTLAIGSSVFSLFAALLMVSGTPDSRAPVMLAVLAAWLLTHTTFALRYAHLYYRDKSSVGGEGVGGLAFPSDTAGSKRAPCDFDFAYFSFTIGMCFQVSDVTVTSPSIRRTVLLHAVLSYVYSTVVLALTLNLVFAQLG